MSETTSENQGKHSLELVREPIVHHRLKRVGIDSNRLSGYRLGWPRHLLWRGYPPWVRTMALGFAVWAAVVPIERAGWILPPGARTLASLLIGLLILQAACDAFVTATERLAARQMWDHYVVGTISEILSTLPELVVIAFVIPVSPLAAMIIALVTIYNNALVFSLYSYFLPKDHKGRFLMPAAITEAGTRVLIAGAAVGSVVGLTMLALLSSVHPKQAFSAVDLTVLALIMFAIFCVYLYKLIRGYASEEEVVRAALDLRGAEID